MEKNQIRGYIKMRFLLGIDAQTICNEIQKASPESAVHIRTVFRWIQYFKSGGESTQDDPRSGRPNTAVTQSNINDVKLFIEEDPYCTYYQIEEAFSLSHGSIHTIIHEHLKLRKITSRWVPHILTEKNREERVRICKENLAKIKENKWRLGDIVTGDESWFYYRQIGRKQANKSWVGEGENQRTVVKLGRYEPKLMFCIFFKQSGVVQITYFEKGATINHQSYIDYCLKPIVEEPLAIHRIRQTLLLLIIGYSTTLSKV